MKPLKVSISTVGCRANQADSALFVRHLDSRRVEVISGIEGADVAIVNTCCVTAEAERDCRKLARRIIAASPLTRVVFVGCAVNAVDRFGDEISGDIIKKGGKEADPKALAAWINGMAKDMGVEEATQDLASHQFAGRTRGLLKIQTGCRHRCAYCIVPMARGPERSMPESEVLEELRGLKQSGYREVVITGVQMGAWGKDLATRPNLSDLVVKAADTLAPGRLRLSSIEPWSVSKELIDAVARHERICPHFHLPLQNGDDGILKAMGRGYTSQEYLSIVELIRKSLPNAAVGTDIILGFPGEDDRAFENTVAVVREAAPAYVHAFSYSPRPGTRAARLTEHPPRDVVRERNRVIRELGADFSKAFRSQHVGRTHEIIVEEVTERGVRGLTDTFVKAYFQKSDNFASGELVKARVVDENRGALFVECIE